MALVFCTRCGHRVSTTAPKCPRCGTAPYGTRNKTEPSANKFPEVPATFRGSPGATVLPAKEGDGKFRRVLKLFQQHRTATLAASAVLFVILGFWSIFYLPNTPSYAIYQCYEEVKARDGTAAASCIDFDEIMSKLAADYSEQALANDKDTGTPEKAFGAAVGGGILGLMSKPLAGMLRSRFERFVENATEEDQQRIRGMALQAIWKLRRNGWTAHTRVARNPNERLDITLRYSPTSGWQVSELGGPAVREVLADPNVYIAQKMKEKAQSDIVEFKTALDRFYVDNGFYPSTEQGLQALVEPPTTGRIPTNYENGGYVKRVPRDPWENAYFYQSDGSPGSRYVLRSFGPDGVASGDDIDASQL